jgi:hypothetical protein
MRKDIAIFFIEDHSSYNKGDILLLTDLQGLEGIKSSSLTNVIKSLIIPFEIFERFREIQNLEMIQVEDEWSIKFKDTFKGLELEKKYKEMTLEVYAQMATVFGTQDPNSASAYKQTWDMMLQSPSSFSGAGLTSRFEVAGLSIGDALDTDQKVTDYATACVDAAIQYGIWRMQRIEQFRQERADILAGKSV